MKLAQRARIAQPFHAMSIGARARQIEAAGGHVRRADGWASLDGR